MLLQKAGLRCLAKQWTKEVLDPKNTRTWQDRRQAECDACAAERRRRCIVAGASDFGPNPKDSKFLQAPFVHGLNAAKYVAALLRARWVAAEQRHLLLCVVAQDTPLFHTDPDTEAHELQHRKEQWLQRHDQATAGIMGLLPLLPGMPVRITQTLPELKPWGLFKNTRGQLFGWSLAEEDIAAIPACQQPELVLQKMPACLFVSIPGATWQHRPGLPPGGRLHSPGRATLEARSPRHRHGRQTRFSAGLRLCWHGAFVYGGHISCLQFGLRILGHRRKPGLTAQCLHVPVPSKKKQKTSA